MTVETFKNIAYAKCKQVRRGLIDSTVAEYYLFGFIQAMKEMQVYNSKMAEIKHYAFNMMYGTEAEKNQAEDFFNS